MKSFYSQFFLVFVFISRVINFYRKSRSLHLGEITNTSSVIFDDTENSYEKPKRSVNEIRLIIRQLVKTSLAALEKAFSEVDKQSSGCLKPETAVELLGRLV